MQDKKYLINFKHEQSKIIERIEGLRQLILDSSMRQDRIIRLDENLDAMMYQINIGYQDKINSSEEIGNI